MPDVKILKPGDTIRLLSVPISDLLRREREKDLPKDEDWMCTATTIEQIIRENPIVEIEFIDEYGSPWYYRNGHSIMLHSDDTWEPIQAY